MEDKLINGGECMNELAATNENWISKQELMNVCGCSDKTLEQIIADFNIETGFDIKNHMKKGGYRNLEVFYDDYLVKLIQAKLLNSQANQGSSSDVVKELAANDYIYTAKEIWELSNSSKGSWDRFVAEFLSLTGEAQKSDYLEEHPSRLGGNKYTDKTLKAFQAWLLRNQANQGSSSDVVKELAATAVKNELSRVLSKEEVKIELARNKTLQLQSKAQIENSKAQIENSKAQIENSKAQRQIVTEQEKSKREQIRYDKEQVIFQRKQAEAEIARQKNISKAIKVKEKGYKQLIDKLYDEIEIERRQAEYTKRLKDFDSLGKYILYIFKDSTKPGQYKIGKTNALGNRLAIGYAENSTLEILYYKKCLGQQVCDDLEREVHEYLKDKNARNYYTTGSKEWFYLSNSELQDVVDKFHFCLTNHSN